MKTHKSTNQALHRRLRNGFTLIELLLVLVILATLAGIVAPSYVKKGEDAKIKTAKTQIAMLKSALLAFELDNGFFPQGKDGLLALVQQPRDAAEWKGPYLQELTIPTDPWGNPYIYEAPGEHNPTAFDIVSSGPDGHVGSGDDIASWQVAMK